MEENKLLNQIKSAAENAETKDFPGMDKVWNRVEEKLDKKEDKKAIWRWKKIAVAASLLLFGTLGYQFLKTDPNKPKTNEAVTVNDSIKKTSPVETGIATAEIQNPAIKEEAAQILEKQIVASGQMAAMESTLATKEKAESVTEADANQAPAEVYKFTVDDAVPKLEEGMYNSATANNNAYLRNSSKMYFKKAETKDVELFVEKNGKTAIDKKEDPLVVLEDKVTKRRLEDIEFNASDSLVVLKEPLYIINGVEFTEQEVFGPKPTSPYTPLTKQDIETISILQNEKAIEIYGDKGKNGVVIITTKTRKPVSASPKAK